MIIKLLVLNHFKIIIYLRNKKAFIIYKMILIAGMVESLIINKELVTVKSTLKNEQEENVPYFIEFITKL